MHLVYTHVLHALHPMPVKDLDPTLPPSHTHASSLQPNTHPHPTQHTRPPKQMLAGGVYEDSNLRMPPLSKDAVVTRIRRAALTAHLPPYVPLTAAADESEQLITEEFLRLRCDEPQAAMDLAAVGVATLQAWPARLALAGNGHRGMQPAAAVELLRKVYPLVWMDLRRFLGSTDPSDQLAHFAVELPVDRVAEVARLSAASGLPRISYGGGLETFVTHPVAACLVPYFYNPSPEQALLNAETAAADKAEHEAEVARAALMARHDARSRASAAARVARVAAARLAAVNGDGSSGPTQRQRFGSAAAAPAAEFYRPADQAQTAAAGAPRPTFARPPLPPGSPRVAQSAAAAAGSPPAAPTTARDAAPGSQLDSGVQPAGSSRPSIFVFGKGTLSSPTPPPGLQPSLTGAPATLTGAASPQAAPPASRSFGSGADGACLAAAGEERAAGSASGSAPSFVVGSSAAASGSSSLQPATGGHRLRAPGRRRLLREVLGASALGSGVAQRAGAGGAGCVSMSSGGGAARTGLQTVVAAPAAGASLQGGGGGSAAAAAAAAGGDCENATAGQSARQQQQQQQQQQQ
jgi:hypothetical protein